MPSSAGAQIHIILLYYHFEEFVKDRKTVKAIIRSIEVIGEAASKISAQLRAEHPNVPWKQIVGMRNHMIHVYFDIDYQTVWQTVKEDLPLLPVFPLTHNEGGGSTPSSEYKFFCFSRISPTRNAWPGCS